MDAARNRCKLGVKVLGDVVHLPSAKRLPLKARVAVNLQAMRTGNVLGLCGAFEPTHDFANAFTARDGTVVSIVGNTLRWGGPVGGNTRSRSRNTLFRLLTRLSRQELPRCRTRRPLRVRHSGQTICALPAT